MDFVPQPAPIVFPPIKQLFKESWDNLIAKLLPLLIFNSIAIGIGVLAAVLLFIVLVGTVSLSSLSSSFLVTLPIILLFIVWAIVTVAIFFVFQIGNILVLSGSSAQPSYKAILRQSFSLFLPLMIGQLLVSFFVLGGLILFIIPGIIFGLFFQFVIFLIVLDKLNPKEALKRSAFIVSKAFGQIFIRILLILLVPFIFQYALNLVTSYSLDEATLGIINAIFTLFFSFFSISYNIILFKQVKAYSGEGSNNIRFIALVSLIGWILGAVITFIGFRAIGTAPVLNTITPPVTLPSGSDQEMLLDDAELISTPSATPVIRTSPTPIRSTTPVSTTSATPR